MTHDRHEQMLRDLQQEREDAERQLATLQQRVDALRKATDGMEELLRSERDATPQAPSEMPPPLPAKKPTTGGGAMRIVQENIGRRLNVRDIWEEMVARGWAENSKDGRSAVRIALTRLAQKHPDQLERVPDGATFAYSWKGGNANGYPRTLSMFPAGRTDS